MKSDTAMMGSDLAELNEGFLALAVGGEALGLSDEVLARLTGLSSLRRQRLAAVPFALFSFGFEDRDCWTRMLSPGVRELCATAAVASPQVERFTLLALTFIRALARWAPQRASACVGLPWDTRERLAAFRIGELGLVASLAAVRLRGRLAGDETWWIRLLLACERADERQLGMLGDFGMQWTIRRALQLEKPPRPVGGFRR